MAGLGKLTLDVDTSGLVSGIEVAKAALDDLAAAAERAQIAIAAIGKPPSAVIISAVQPVNASQLR